MTLEFFGTFINDVWSFFKNASFYIGNFHFTLSDVFVGLIVMSICMLLIAVLLGGGEDD